MIVKRLILNQRIENASDIISEAFLLQERSIEYTLTSDGLLVSTNLELFASEINKILVFGGVDLETLKPIKNSLEQIFFELTENIA